MCKLISHPFIRWPCLAEAPTQEAAPEAATAPAAAAAPQTPDDSKVPADKAVPPKTGKGKGKHAPQVKCTTDVLVQVKTKQEKKVQEMEPSSPLDNEKRPS
jgi:hypothetical protein